MKEIVQETGMSKGAFYHYFSSKEQVFEEVVGYFYGDTLTINYETFSQESLYDFYHQYLKLMDQQMNKARSIVNIDEDEHFFGNYFILIFDAIKLIPRFQKGYIIQQQLELKAWMDVIKVARKRGEIKTVASDSQLAKLFIYSGDGLGLNSIMAGSMEKVKKEVKAIWDALYNALKA